MEVEDIKIPTEELITILRQRAEQIKDMNCLGCGHEHGCSVHGCAILRALAEKLERERWISVEERMPEEEGVYLCRYTFANSDGSLSNLRSMGCIRYHHAESRWQHASLRLRVTHWRELPEPPEGDHYESI